MKILPYLLPVSGCAGFLFAAQSRPNLLVLLTDDQRLNTLGCYDASCPINTSAIDRLANEGIRFDNGFVTTPICVVSRASILTGRYATNTRLHQFQTIMAEDVFNQSYPVILRDAGYFTGQLGKYGVGIRPDQKKQFDVYEAQDGQGPAFRDYQGRKVHDSEWLTIKTEEFLNRVPAGKPFALQVNYKAPHGSAAVAPEDDHLLDDYDFPFHPMDNPEERAKLPEFVQKSFLDVCYRQEFMGKIGDHNPFLRDYFEKIYSVERSVGTILKMLEERKLLKNTVIVFLSDHGAHFGEKQLYGKWTPYEGSLRTPFIIYDPRPQSQKGVVNTEMVLNIDIAPTLLELAGVPVPEIMDGKSLVPLITGKQTAWRDHFFFEHFTSPAMARYIPRHVGIRTKTDKYFHWIDPQCDTEEYYDLALDPFESNNLISNPDYSHKVNELRNQYLAWRKEHPSTYNYDPYGRRAQAIAPEIDWNEFKKVRPEIYQEIEKQLKSLGVTWDQAMAWEVRYEIGSKIGYWY